MKKTISLIMAVVMFMTFVCTGCASTENTQQVSCDDIILENAKYIAEQKNPIEVNPFSNSEYMFTVQKDGEKYNVNINGDKHIIMFTNNEEGEGLYVPTAVKKFEDKNTVQMINRCKKKVINYITESKLLTNKEELSKRISELEVYTAELTDDESVGAIWHYEDEVIYVEQDNVKYVCEWMFVHEMIHALSFYTHNSDIGNEEYGFTKFNEAFTDLITSAILYGSEEMNYSGYAKYFEWLFPFVDNFGEDAISAYFYGYDEIVNKIGSQEEMDLYVQTMERICSYDIFTLVVYNHLIYKWQLI